MTDILDRPAGEIEAPPAPVTTARRTPFRRLEPLRARRPRQVAAPRPEPLRVAVFSDAQQVEVLHRSVIALQENAPELSAKETLAEHQKRGLYLFAAAALLGLLFLPILTLTVLTGLCTFVYTAVVLYRVLLFRKGVDGGHLQSVSNAAARAVPDADLPIYTVLVPAYDEPEVLPRLISHLAGLEYPKDKLEVKLLLEEDDEATFAAVKALRPGPWLEVVKVPTSEPRTKPKACNVGLEVAKGEFLTIFDAEDRPDPLQLRKAVVVFRRSPEISCLQARLDYDNASQNRITKWFTAEYGAWFGQLLPGLVAVGAPLPLGGTSNHIRRTVLDEAGAWDPFNVTEDADLGIRLARTGHQVAVLDSVTYEEANSDFVNWIKQRSRWHKGYLQTWLVHMRSPRKLYGELGLKGFVGFNLFVGGTPVLHLLNPLFWTLTALWFLAEPDLIEAIFPAPIYYPALACWAIGNFMVVYIGVVGVRENGRPELTLNALISPVYWVMMSIAAIKAFSQLIKSPSFWEKTKHGLAGAAAHAGSVSGKHRPVPAMAGATMATSKAP